MWAVVDLIVDENVANPAKAYLMALSKSLLLK